MFRRPDCSYLRRTPTCCICHAVSPKHWPNDTLSSAGADFHGFSTSGNWQFPSLQPCGIGLCIEGSRYSAIRWFARSIAVRAVFPMPKNIGGSLARCCGFSWDGIFRFPVEPNVSILERDAVFEELSYISPRYRRAGTRRPLIIRAQKNWFTCAVSTGAYWEKCEENDGAELVFDTTAFPNIMMWILNRGRTRYPWYGQFLGLGVCIVFGAFDLGQCVSCRPKNPVAYSGFPIACQLNVANPFHTAYSIEVSDH